MSQNNKKTQSGFTIIELTIAMAFVSVLLVAIALTIIQISGIYNRGITLKQVNQAGRTISYDLQDSITATTPFSLETGVVDEPVSIVKQSWGGALCLGNYSYVWNNGKAIRDAAISGKYDEGFNTYKNVTYSGTMPDSKIIRFVKVFDPDSAYCIQDAQGNIAPVDSTQATELLSVGQNNLVIQNFEIMTNESAAVATTSQQLYDIKFVIGTNDPDALDGEGVTTSCKPPSAFSADPTYCSIEQFHVVARAGNSK